MKVGIFEWCDVHWELLRTMVNDAGLEPWVSKGGEAAAASMARSIEVNDPKEPFDPLLWAWAALNTRQMDMGLGVSGCIGCLIQGHVDQCTNPKCHVPKGDGVAVREMFTNCINDGLIPAAREAGMIPTQSV